jgi:hypothetical protein
MQGDSLLVPRYKPQARDKPMARMYRPQDPVRYRDEQVIVNMRPDCMSDNIKASTLLVVGCLDHYYCYYVALLWSSKT